MKNVNVHDFYYSSAVVRPGLYHAFVNQELAVSVTYVEHVRLLFHPYPCVRV